MKRVATEEIIEEIKQEPGQEGDATGSESTASTSSSILTTTATTTTSMAAPAIIGAKVKRLDTNNSYSIGVRKSSLSNLVVKKKQPTPAVAAATATSGVSSEAKSVETKTTAATSSVSSSAANPSGAVASSSASVGPVVSGLGLLGAYSDSENSSDGNE